MTNAQIFAVVAKNFTLVTHRAGRELTKENLLTYDMYDVIITSFIKICIFTFFYMSFLPSVKPNSLIILLILWPMHKFLQLLLRTLRW